MLRAGTTGKLCTWEKACGTEQGRDKGCPMPFRLAKISQQRWAKQGICILLDRAQKCFNMRRCLTMLSLPAPHCRFVCHTGVDGFAIHHILDNRRLVMLVRPDKVRLLNMNMSAGRTDSYGNIQLNSAAAFHDEFTPVRAVTGQWRMAKRANAFRFI